MTSTNTQRIGLVGAGQMGSGLALLFSDHGYKVSAFDVSEKFIQQLDKDVAKEENHRKNVRTFTSMEEFMKSFEGKRRVLVLSITHGHPVDEVLEKLNPFVSKGDIVLDGGNEWYLESERRQEAALKKGYHLLSLGVSGGYQSARRGPSMTPSGDRAAYDQVADILKEVASKDADTGVPCVDYIGVGGSGHYVKMIHNGIEQGSMCVACEAYGVMRHVLGMSHEAAGKAFAEWNSKGELLNNFLIQISSEIAAHKVDGDYLLDKIEDKVVQDADNSEGTGVWSVKEAASRHIGCPTIADAHFMRIVSAHRDDRESTHKRWTSVVKDLASSRGASSDNNSEVDQQKLEQLRLATYGGVLAAFLQGFNVIAQASRDFKWKINMHTLIKCWKNGCIIRSDYIMEVLSKAYAGDKQGEEPLRNICADSAEIADEVNRCYAALKATVLAAIEAGVHVPALTASLEYFKICASTDLPTRFMEAQLDFFGAHCYNLVEEHNFEIKKGPHHHEWRQA